MMFPAELLFFGVLAFSRFFDHKLQEHAGAFVFMESYGGALVVTLAYLLLFFTFCVFLLRRAGAARNREMGYLISFLAVFMIPFFLHKNYFGTSDTVVLLLVLAAELFLVGMKGKNLSDGSRRLWRRETAILAILLLPGIGTAVVLGFVKGDVQPLLSVRQFIVMLLFFSPYLFFAARFFWRLLRKDRGAQRGIYLAYALGSALPAALWILAGDYSRAVFYAFVCYIFPAVCFAALGDEIFIESMAKEKKKIVQTLSFPAVFVFYPLIFITFWMMGWESIPAEEILKLQ